MNQHFKRLRDALDREKSSGGENAGVAFDDEVTDPYSSLADSDFCVTGADEDINDAAWGRQVRRPAPKGKRGY